MDQAENTRPAKRMCNYRRPAGIREQCRSAGQHQRHGDQGENQVGNAPADREALEEFLPVFQRQTLGTHVLD